MAHPPNLRIYMQIAWHQAAGFAPKVKGAHTGRAPADVAPVRAIPQGDTGSSGRAGPGKEPVEPGLSRREAVQGGKRQLGGWHSVREGREW